MVQKFSQKREARFAINDRQEPALMRLPCDRVALEIAQSSPGLYDPGSMLDVNATPTKGPVRRNFDPLLSDLLCRAKMNPKIPSALLIPGDPAIDCLRANRLMPLQAQASANLLRAPLKQKFLANDPLEFGSELSKINPVFPSPIRPA